MLIGQGYAQPGSTFFRTTIKVYRAGLSELAPTGANTEALCAHTTLHLTLNCYVRVEETSCHCRHPTPQPPSHLQANCPYFSECHKEHPGCKHHQRKWKMTPKVESLGNLCLHWVERRLPHAKENTPKRVFPALALRSATVHRKAS